MSDLTVALDAMRADAVVWDGAGSILGAPARVIDSLGLTAQDVSMFGVDAGVDKAYGTAQTALVDMLNQGMQNFHNLANTLRQAATTYEQHEDHASSQIKGAGGS